MRHLLWIPLLALTAGCGGGGARTYSGTWDGSCELEGETWALDLTLEKTDGDPAGQIFVIIDSFGYERYYTGTIDGILDGDALRLRATVIPTDNPDGDGRDFDLDVIVDGDEMSGDCSGDSLDGTATLERE